MAETRLDVNKLLQHELLGQGWHRSGLENDPSAGTGHTTGYSESTPAACFCVLTQAYSILSPCSSASAVYNTPETHMAGIVISKVVRPTDR